MLSVQLDLEYANWLVLGILDVSRRALVLFGSSGLNHASVRLSLVGHLLDWLDERILLVSRSLLLLNRDTSWSDLVSYSAARHGSGAGPRSLVLLRSLLLVKDLRSDFGRGVSSGSSFVLVHHLVLALVGELVHLSLLLLHELVLLLQLSSVLGLFELCSLHVEVRKLGMHELDLLVVQAEGLAVDQAADGVELVHEDKVGIVVVVVDGSHVLLQKLVVELVVASLLQFEALDAAAYLEQVLHDIFALSAVLARLGVNHEFGLVLGEQLAEGGSGVVHILVTDEVELLENVDDVDLVVLRDIPLDHLAVFLVERLYLLSLRLLLSSCPFVHGLHRHSSRREEPVSVSASSARRALLRAQETHIREIARHPRVGALSSGAAHVLGGKRGRPVGRTLLLVLLLLEVFDLL